MRRNKPNLTTKLCVRVDPKLKQWVIDQGGSTFIRDLLDLAYLNIMQKEFSSEEGDLT